MKKIISFEGRQFEVEKSGNGYILKGVRGARYRAERNETNPSHLYVFSRNRVFETWLIETEEGDLIEAI